MTERILITGAAGRIGRMLRPRLARPDRVLRLLDVADQEEAVARAPTRCRGGATGRGPRVVLPAHRHVQRAPAGRPGAGDLDHRPRDDAERFAAEVGDRVDPATDILIDGGFCGPVHDMAD